MTNQSRSNDNEGYFIVMMAYDIIIHKYYFNQQN